MGSIKARDLKEMVRKTLVENFSETLTIERSGVFRLKTTGIHHCGTSSNLKIRYKMICTCKNLLDGRGFVFDQVKVDDYFQRKLSSSLSCERLSMVCLRDLLVNIKKENPGCEILDASLTLSPEPFASAITYKVKFSEHPS